MWDPKRTRIRDLTAKKEFIAGLYARGGIRPRNYFMFALFGLLVSTAHASWRSEIYPADWTPPIDKSFATDKLIQDFSYAGYRRGEVSIPEVAGPVFDAVACGADPTGVRDSTSAIQQAIDAAEAAGGGVVVLSAGTFLVAPPDGSKQALCIAGPGVVLRGAGSGKTFLLNTSTSMRSKSVVHFWKGDRAGAPVLLTADLPGPTRRLPLADAGAFAPGDFVELQWDFTPEWVAEHGQQMHWNAGKGFPQSTRYQREVLAVNETEGWIEIDIPTRYTVKARDNARVVKISGLVSECGVEDLSIGNVQHPGSEWMQADHEVKGTSAYDVHASRLIYIQRSRDCWVSNVRSFQPPGNTSTCHMLSNGIQVYKSFRITLRDCVMQRPQYGGGGGNGYMYRVTAGNDNLFERCVAEFSRHGFVVSHAGTSGNVFHRCEDRISNRATGSTGNMKTWRGDGSDNHMYFSHSSLWDQCVAVDSFWEAVHRGHTGNQGLTTAHSVYWNTSGYGSAYPDKLVVTEQGRYGYVIGTGGDVDAVQNRDPFRHNTAPLDHVEGVGLGETLEPQSLYLDQLARRLGSTKESAVQVKQINYKGWADAVELRNDTVRVVVVPSIGRIMHYGFSDGENLLYTNPEMYGCRLVPGEIFMREGKPAGPLFGGDRLVTLPEDMIGRALESRANTDPWLDGRPWESQLTDDGGVSITSPVSRLFGIKLIRKIRLAPHGTTVRIEQGMIKVQPAANPEVDAVPLTIWNLTQLPPPKQTWQPHAPDSVFGKRFYVPGWSAGRVDGNYVIQDGMIRLTPNKQKSQKIGTDARGWVAGWTGSALMIERFDYIEGETYPEGGTSTAVYTNPSFAELECLSPQKVLSVRDSIQHTIWWELHRVADEPSAIAILKNL